MSVGEPKVESLKKPTKLEFKYPENSLPAKLFAFLNQKKFADTPFSPNVFKRPFKEVLNVDRKARSRASAAIQAHAILDRLSKKN